MPMKSRDHHAKMAFARVWVAVLVRTRAIMLAAAAMRTMMPVVVMAAPLPAVPDNSSDSDRHIYYVGGVHNDKGCAPPRSCVYTREPGMYLRTTTWWAR